MAAVAALAESFGLLAGAWAFGAFGIFMGFCGFAGLAFHPDILSSAPRLSRGSGAPRV